MEKRAFDVGKNDFSTEGQDQQPASLFQVVRLALVIVTQIL